jgi:hypothetical protein
MDGDYICPNCQTLYTLEGLKDNEDGICLWCGCPLESLHGETFFNMQTLGQEPNNYPFKNRELNLMVTNLRVYPIDDVWHSVELLKNVKDRIKERKLFFEALIINGQKFELWED